MHGIKIGREKNKFIFMHRWHGCVIMQKIIIFMYKNLTKPRKIQWLMNKTDPRIQGQHTEINWF